MLTNLATFLHAHGRRVLLVAVIGAAIAGAFGVGVAKHMSPYGADDPATQSVQATHRFEAAAGRKIDPGIVAIVSAGDVHSAATQRRVEQVAGRLRTQPEVSSAVSYYETHDPSMVSRDRNSTYVVAYFKPLSDTELEDAAQRIEDQFADDLLYVERAGPPGAGGGPGRGFAVLLAKQAGPAAGPGAGGRPLPDRAGRPGSG